MYHDKAYTTRARPIAAALGDQGAVQEGGARKRGGKPGEPPSRRLRLAQGIEQLGARSNGLGIVRQRADQLLRHRPEPRYQPAR